MTTITSIEVPLARNKYIQMENLVDREDRSKMFEKWSHLNWKEELDLLDYSD